MESRVSRFRWGIKKVRVEVRRGTVTVCRLGGKKHTQRLSGVHAHRASGVQRKGEKYHDDFSHRSRRTLGSRRATCPAISSSSITWRKSATSDCRIAASDTGMPWATQRAN
mgnify:CR=1 FL=1